MRNTTCNNHEKLRDDSQMYYKHEMRISGNVRRETFQSQRFTYISSTF